VISFGLMDSAKWQISSSWEFMSFYLLVHVSHNGQHFSTIIIKEGLDSSCISSFVFPIFHHNQITLLHFFKLKYYITISLKKSLLLYFELIHFIILILFFLSIKYFSYLLGKYVFLSIHAIKVIKSINFSPMKPNLV